MREQLDERIYNFFVTEEYIDDCGLGNQSHAWKGVGLMKDELRRGYVNSTRPTCEMLRQDFFSGIPNLYTSLY